MNDDELREKIARLNPIPDHVAVELPTTVSARTRMEQIMSNDTLTPQVPGAPTQRSSQPSKRTRWILAASAAAIAAVAVGVAALSLKDDDKAIVASAPLVLSLGVDDVLASCMPVDATVMADMPVAFAGTATAVDGEVVTLRVDRWYQGGDATEVQLTSTAGQAALIAGFDVEVGTQYLITATGGSVNFCGFSGPASPELQAVFDTAFGA